MRRAYCAILLAALAASAAAQDTPKMKKFLTKPLVIEDQGSFFVGGVPKVTNYATVPRQPQSGADSEPDHDRTNVRPVRDTGDEETQCGAGHYGARVESYRGMSGIHAGRAGGLVSLLRTQRHFHLSGRSGRAWALRLRRIRNQRSGGHYQGGDAAKGLAMVPAVARITDNGAWTNWFGHLIPPGSNILNGTLIQHGDPGEAPSDAAIHGNDYHPAYPLGAIDAKVAAREGAIGPAPSGPANDLALEYYKQLVPNSEVTLPGSFAPPASLRRSHPLTPGRRRIWLRWSKSLAARSSRPILNRELWAIIWFGF